MVRIDGRAFDEVRAVSISLGVQPYAEGSVQIESGSTSVVCAVSVNDGVPPFMQGTGTGWVTAEYGMLPRATHTRNQREGRGKGLKGRTQEIQRLIGRSLRAAVDLSNLGERTLMVDCDVLQADGGTRTAAITGSYVALQQAVKTLINRGDLSSSPFTSAIASNTGKSFTGFTVMLIVPSDDVPEELVIVNLISSEPAKSVFGV